MWGETVDGLRMMRCAYCRRRYLWSTFLVRIEATCTDCLPLHGWPARFHLLGRYR